jgi:hypothetical protein
VLDRLQDKVDAVKSAYVKPTGRDEQLRQMRQIVERARTELGAG